MYKYIATTEAFRMFVIFFLLFFYFYDEVGYMFIKVSLEL